VTCGPFMKVLGRVDELCVKSWFRPVLERQFSVLDHDHNLQSRHYAVLCFIIYYRIAFRIIQLFFSVKKIHQILSDCFSFRIDGAWALGQGTFPNCSIVTSSINLQLPATFPPISSISPLSYLLFSSLLRSIKHLNHFPPRPPHRNHQEPSLLSSKFISSVTLPSNASLCPR
jgi:hypothetical protein